MSLVNFIQFPALGDERGQLYVMEEKRNIPFDIKRAYYLVGTLEGVSRGFHAHKELQQIAVCVSGKCKMLLDDGKQRCQVLLDEPNKAIRIDKMVWHEMHDFTSDCVLLVLANDYYDESDYIRSYEDFLMRANNE